MSKNVLGNDPFVRGAAKTAGPPPPPEIPISTRRPVAKRHAFKSVSQAPTPTLPPSTKLGTGAPPGEGEPFPTVLAPRASESPSLLEGLVQGSKGLAATLYSTLRAALNGSDDTGASLLDSLCQHYWGVGVEGAQDVPNGPLIVVANQAGAIPLGGLILPWALHRTRPDLKEARWLADPALLDTPWLGTVLTRLGAVKASPESALALLQAEHPVVVFPEGLHGMSKRFSERHHLRRFGRGFVKLALRTGARILPTACVGGAESSPLLGRIPAEFGGLHYFPLTPLPLPAQWRVRFGTPLEASAQQIQGEDDTAGIERLVEQTRHAIVAQLETLLQGGSR